MNERRLDRVLVTALTWAGYCLGFGSLSFGIGLVVGDRFERAGDISLALAVALFAVAGGLSLIALVLLVRLALIRRGEKE